MLEIQLVIVENDFLVGQEIGSLAEEAGFSVALNVQSGGELWARIGQVNADLVLMDIDLEEKKDGIDLAIDLKRTYGLPVLFISGMTDARTLQRAQSVFPNSFNYLTKPVKLADLRNLVHHLLDKKPTQPSGFLEKLRGESLFIQEGTAQVPIPKSEIVLIESDGSYCTIRTDKKSYSVSSNLKKIHAALADERFFRISRSHVINLEKTVKLSTYEVEITVGNEHLTLDIGKTYKESYQVLRDRLSSL